MPWLLSCPGGRKCGGVGNGERERKACIQPALLKESRTVLWSKLRTHRTCFEFLWIIKLKVRELWSTASVRYSGNVPQLPLSMNTINWAKLILKETLFQRDGERVLLCNMAEYRCTLTEYCMLAVYFGLEFGLDNFICIVPFLCLAHCYIWL